MRLSSDKRITSMILAIIIKAFFFILLEFGFKNPLTIADTSKETFIKLMDLWNRL